MELGQHAIPFIQSFFTTFYLKSLKGDKRGKVPKPLNLLISKIHESVNVKLFQITHAPTHI